MRPSRLCARSASSSDAYGPTMAWYTCRLPGDRRVNAGRPNPRTCAAARPAPSPLSSEANVTLKLAPVETVETFGDPDHGNIEAIAGCGARNQTSAPASTSRKTAAAAVRRFNV